MLYVRDEGERKSDERKELRWRIAIPVFVKGVRRDGTEFNEETIATDVSHSGMRLLLTLALRKGDRIKVSAPEEKFESSATVRWVRASGNGMNRIGISFPKSARFNRDFAAKKYIYDYYRRESVGYILDKVYYNAKHEPFGKIENNQIVSLASGSVLFTLEADRAYATGGGCIGHTM